MNRILLIEDDAGAQLLFKNRLNDLGYEVVVASTGARGLLEARTAAFDLFLVDIELGSGIDGYEVCGRLKAIPTIRNTPVVLISGRVKGQEDLHRGYEAGCEAFLLKGDITLMEDAVRAMLRIKSLQDDLAMQNHLLEERNRHLQIERKRAEEFERILGGREVKGGGLDGLAGSCPDAAMVVDGDGVVRSVTRGAQDLLGKDVEGKHLASLAPESGLEAFVNDARTASHDPYRFTLAARGGRAPRSVSASVLPLMPSRGGEVERLKVVLLVDTEKRGIVADMMRLDEEDFRRREIAALIEAARGVYQPCEILGESGAMADLRARVAQAAEASSPVLLRGESGTGKKFIARVLHYSSGVSGPFLPVHCGALRDQQLDSELFGYDANAFPGAGTDHPGALEQAHRGTVFLEEVHELPAELQAKLLQVLEEGRATRLGSQKARGVDVRILASSSGDLEALVAAGKFRKDLFYQLSALHLLVPPLRQRMGDIEVLGEHFLRRFGSSRGVNAIAADTVWLLTQYDWPGNVREFESTIESACALTSGDQLVIQDLPQPFAELARRLEGKEASDTIPRLGSPLDLRNARVAEPEAPAYDDPLQAFLGDETERSLKTWEKIGLQDALLRANGDKLQAAKILGIGKSTFYRKLKSHGLS